VFGDVFSEVRVGYLANDVGLTGPTYETGENVNLEMLFQSPDGLLESVFAPRPYLGASINNEGATSQVYLGLNWQLDLPVPHVFGSLGLGATIHDGELAPDFEDRKALGSRLLFREAVELGARIGERHSLSLMFDHISNASMANYNEGLDSFGIRYGFRF
jgi:lipid A 3-O-deacylase